MPGVSGRDRRRKERKRERGDKPGERERVGGVERRKSVGSGVCAYEK